MAISTLQHLLSRKYLRLGGGIVAVPTSRRAERVFGAEGLGRSKALTIGKLESVGAEYNPREDTCVKAFVRFLALRALSNIDN